jgi:EAL domain-containing protein (putative c-di-GMP-specific phosphodiesterase class I)
VWLGGGQLAGFVASSHGGHLDGPLDREEQRADLESGVGSGGGSDPAVAIDGWLVAQATRTLGRWRNEGLTADLTVIASVSTSSLRTPGFVESVLSGIADSRLPTSHVVLALPHHAFGAERDAVRMNIAALHARGVGVAVDDLESADARAAMPGLLISQLVINPSLIASLAVDRARAALVRELASLARLLGAVAIADGIETEDQALAAHEAGCRLGRGPYFGAPEPAGEIERWLHAARSGG